MPLPSMMAFIVPSGRMRPVVGDYYLLAAAGMAPFLVAS